MNKYTFILNFKNMSSISEYLEKLVELKSFLQTQSIIKINEYSSEINCFKIKINSEFIDFYNEHDVGLDAGQSFFTYGRAITSLLNFINKVNEVGKKTFENKVFNLVSIDKEDIIFDTNVILEYKNFLKNMNQFTNDLFDFLDSQQFWQNFPYIRRPTNYPDWDDARFYNKLSYDILHKNQY